MPIVIDKRGFERTEVALCLSATQPTNSGIREPVYRRHPARAVAVLGKNGGLIDNEPGAPWHPARWNTYLAWRYNGSLDIDTLESATNELVGRHAVLKCTLENVSGEWHHVPNRAPEARLCKLECHSEGAILEDNAGLALSEFVFREFNLEREGPIRFAYIRISEDDYLICVVVHHAVTDAYSNRIISFELASLYDSLYRKERRFFRRVPFSYLDYLLSIEEWIDRTDSEPFLRYWSEYIEGSAIVNYERTNEITQGSFNVSKELSICIRRVCAVERIGINLFWEAVHHVTLHKLLCLSNLTTLTVDLGRRQAELLGIIGRFVNFLPCRSEIFPGTTLRSLLRQLHRGQQQSSPYRSTPCELIADRCRFEYMTAFGHLNFIPCGLQAMNSFGDFVRVPYQPAKNLGGQSWPYAVVVLDRPEFSVVWIGDVAKPFGMKDFGEALERVSRTLAREPDRELSTLLI